MVIHHGYKRSHYYMVLLFFVVVITGMYVVGITDIFSNHPTVVAPTNISTTTSDTASTTQSVVVKIFGTPVVGDIGVGPDTKVAFVTEQSGGSGTFYYAVAFMKVVDKYVNTNQILLGDRIAPQGIDISNHIASFNFCDRKADEPFTVKPSMCVTKRFDIVEDTLTEVIP